jgi:hypothetical protein
MFVVHFGLLAVITLVLLTLGLESILRRWAGRPIFSLKFKAQFSNHGKDGLGSWLLSPEVMSSRDARFSLSHWNELTAWRMRTYERPSNERWYQQPGGPPLNRLSAIDVAGSEFSIRNRERTTTDQPAPHLNEVMCFGGSTTFCMEVSDQNSWCSVLQRMVGVEFPSQRIRVRNFGIPGTPGLERIETFKSVFPPGAGDIAVFLFGDNDSGWKQYGIRHGRIHTHLPGAIKFLLRISDYSEIAAWLYGETSPRHLRRLAVEMARTTIKAAEEASKFARSRGAHVLFVLQPNVYTLAQPEEWDERIIMATAKDHRIVIEAAYQIFSEWISESRIAVSATHIFDSEKPSPYMGDALHTNTRGCELIGQFVFSELKSKGLLAESTRVST